MKKRRFREFVANWLRENPHFWYSLLLLPIFICYFVPEQLIVTGYHPTQIVFDSMIPLLPGFVYCYLLWFPLLVFGGFWLLLTDGVVFRRYMVFLTVAYLISAAVYLSYPNGQDLRPTNLNVHDLSTTILAFIYRVDTNTNVLPSLHVIGSVGAAAALCKSESIRSGLVKAAIVILAVLVSISTVFIKQHGIVDVIAGLAVGLLLCPIICRKTKK